MPFLNARPNNPERHRSNFGSTTKSGSSSRNTLNSMTAHPLTSCSKLQNFVTARADTQLITDQFRKEDPSNP